MSESKPTYFYAKMRMASGAEHLVYLDGYELENDAPTHDDFDRMCLLTEKIIAEGRMSDWTHKEPYGPMLTTHTDEGTVVCINRHMVESYAIVTQDT